MEEVPAPTAAAVDAPSEAAAHRKDGSLPAVTGLRAIAIILVLVIHCPALLLADPHVHAKHWLVKTQGAWLFGGTGVDLFFVLSGFLLFSPYAKAIVTESVWPSAKIFYRNRARRVVPAYWIALVVLISFGSAAGADPRGSTASKLLHFVFLQNWSSSDYYNIDRVFWTMAVEVQFYVLLPWVALLLRRMTRGRTHQLVGLLLIFVLVTTPSAEVVKHIALARSSDGAPHLSIIDVWEFGSAFLGGMTVAAIRADRLYSAQKSVWSGRLHLLATIGVVTLTARFLANALKLDLGGLGQASFNTLVAIGYAGLVLGVLELWPRIASALSARWLVFVGVISYSLYIWHLPIDSAIILPIVNRCHAGAADLAIMVALTVVIVVPLCWVSYALTERPFYRTRA